MAHLLLYGGTFDPIHHGHLLTCRRAREILHADSVFLIPARISPHKLDPAAVIPASARHRVAMLRLAIEDEPGFTVDERELAREGPSYTIDTVESLRREHPSDGFTLLIGADQLPKFHTWYRIDDLLAQADVAVLARPGSSGQELGAALAQVRDRLSPGAGGRLHPLSTPLVEISATDIRQRVRAGLSIRYLVPPAIDQYIRRHGLYR